MDREACAYISFDTVIFDTGTHFSLQRQSSSSHLVFYHCSRTISNSKQNSDEYEFFWSGDWNQDKTVYYTGTTQPEMETSRAGVKFCRRLFRGGGKYLFAQLLQMQKSQLIDFREHFERYCNVLPVFGFNIAKYDIILIKSYLLPILVTERDLEQTVIKKANQLVYFKFGDIQILDIMNFLGGATSLDSFLKAYQTKETKGFFPYEGFECPEKKNHKEFPPYHFFSAFCAIATPLKMITTTFKTLLTVV